MPNSLHVGRSLSELNELSSRLWHSGTLQEGLDEMLAAVIELLGAPMGNVQILDPEHGVLRIAAHHGFDREFLEFFREVTAADESACGRALRTGERVIIENVEADPGFAPYLNAALVAGYRAVQTTPLIGRDGAPLGAISTHFRFPHQPSQAEFDRLDIYVRQAVNFIERMRSDEKLRASEQRFRDMADTAPVLIWLSGEDKRCTWFNRPWLDFVGRSMEQEIGDGWAENVHPDDLAACVRTYATCFDERRSFTMEYRLRRHDGVYRWVLDSGIPLYEAGRFKGYIGSCVDISDRKEAEDALRDREAELGLVAQATPVILTRCSRDLRYLYINAAGARLFALEPEQVIGRPICEVMDARAFDMIQPHIERVLRGETVEYEEQIPYGPSPRWMRVTYVPDWGPSGRVDGWIGSIVDIDERKHAELQATRLFAALQESDRRKDEFIAILAHELRNPLAPVRNASHYLKLRGLSDPELQKSIDLIDRQVGMIGRLIEDLLDVSRITRGTLELRREPVPIMELIQSAVDACRHEIEASGHALRLSLPVEPLVLNGDRARLIQALCNLLANAVKFSSPGAPVEVEARASDGHVLIAVRDHGKGIPPDQLEKIFELFVQLDRSLERQGGLGIGLTLTRQIAELHGGSVEARSEGPGRGSEFLMRLPIGVVLDARNATAQAKPRVTARRVLVVDDNPDTVDSLAIILEISGHHVEKAFDGAAAFDATQRMLPDVVLLDIGMPKMNGYDVARRIREQPWGERIRLVALTGWGQDKDRRSALDAGFDAHLVKPVAFEAIERILAELPA